MNNPDIDIDFQNRDKILECIKHIPASLDGTRKHNTGIYAQVIPINPFTNVATIDYRAAEERGYFKIDFLNNGVYDKVRDESHLDELLNTEPPWEFLWLNKDFCDQITHVNNYFKLLGKMKPDSIEKMAMFLAIIRPAKKYLIGRDWNNIKKEVWEKPKNNDYYFKRSHATSYAVLVGIHINLLVEQFESQST